jgi:hypothetical protein
VFAATFVIADYAAREIVVADRHIAALEASQATATGLMARALPRRIAGAIAYRDRVRAGEFGFPA